MPLNNDSSSKTLRTVLITGAAGGIGRACVRLFTDSGWRVIGVDRAEFGEPFPENGLYIRADISDGEMIQTIYQQANVFTGSGEVDAVAGCAHQIRSDEKG